MRATRFVLLALVVTAGIGSPLAQQAPPPQPDVNRDGVVDMRDLTIVRDHLGRRCGQQAFDPRADVDHNCVVNGLDVAAVAKSLNTIIDEPPIARIAQTATAFVGQPVMLDGRASSDPEDAALTYQWQLTSRPAGSSASVAAPTTALTSFVPDRPGTYQVRLVVSDGTLTGEANVTVTTTNVAPIAVAGPHQTARVGDTVTFDGTGSSDPDGDALAYAWSIVERPPASVTALSDPAAARPTLVIDAAGTYALRLVVTDAGGLASAPSEVRVSTTNSPPAANAGPDRTVARNAVVPLTGAGSTDPDGDLLAYRWELVERPAGSAAALVPSQGVETSFVADRDGDFLILLTVSDPAGGSAVDTVTVTTLNSVPQANAGEDQSVALGAPVTLDASGSTDVDGDPLTYVWSFASRPEGSAAALSDTGAARPTFVVDLPGTYVLQLIVTDGHGGSSSDTVVISTLNSRPIADAGPDQLVVAGRVVTLDGRNSRDADGDPLTYAWALTTIPQGSAAQLSDPAGAQPLFTVDTPGTYVAQLIVHDGELASLADTVSVSTTNAAPVANAGGDPSRLPVGSLVTLDGTASTDADGHTLSYLWAILVRPSGSSAVLDQPASATPSFTVDAGGDFVVQLIVSDGFASSQPDTVLIRGNMVPVADAGADTTGQVSVPVPLTGAGSSDADGDSLSYAWTLLAPVGSAAFLSNPATATPTFVPDVGGSYVVRLVVHDGYNESAPDLVTVAVEAPRDLSITPAVSSVLTFDRATMTVSSESPAPAGGLLVELHSSDDTLALPPPDVTIPAGETSTTFDVATFARAGTATITATTPGTEGATATVTVALRSLLLTVDAPAVGVNKVMGGAITLANPPPPGGATITLTPGTPEIVGTSPEVASIPDGATTAPLLVVGIAAGSTSLTASAPGFAPAITPVSVRYSLTLAPSPVAVERASSAKVTLILSAPAPSGGATVALTMDAPATATVPASVVIPGGATFGEVVVHGLADGTTTLRATLTHADPASVDVAVTAPPPPQIDSSPADGEGDVAVTRETILRLSRALAADASVTAEDLFAEFGGLVLPTRVHVSPDRKTITLFYLQTLPAAARIRVHFNTDGLSDVLGVRLDGDQDGQPGGTRLIDFDTLTLATLEGTAVVGRVFASQLGDGGVNTPLANVIISVDGLETTLRTTTDAMGNFRLEPAPAGAFFVHIDGRSATNDIPVGGYYPVVGKKWVAKPGDETNIGDVFLPLIAPGTLQPVSETDATTITFPASVLAQHPHLAGVNLIVPADSIYTDGGARGGMVGIAPVPPDRIPSPLPPGLDLALVITVQTDGATNFDRPVPVCFPNLPNPTTGLALAPGAKSALWSFNHDTGDWEVVGPMTAAASGVLVCSDPGVGIRQPGWHGQTAGTQVGIDLKGLLPDISPECRDAAASSAFSLVSWGKDLGRLSLPLAMGVIGGFAGAPAGPGGAIAGFHAAFTLAEAGQKNGELVLKAGQKALEVVFQDLVRGNTSQIWQDVEAAVRPVFRQNILANLNPYLSYAEGIKKYIDDSEKFGKSLGSMLVHCFGFGPQPPPPPPPPPPAVDTDAAYNSLANEFMWPPPSPDEYATFADLINSVPDLIAGGPPLSEVVEFAQSGAEVAELLSEENTSPTPEEIEELTEALEEFTDRAEFFVDHPEQFMKSVAIREREITALLNKLTTPVRQPIEYALSYDDTVIRGSSTTGHIDAILPANTIVTVTILNPVTLQTGGTTVVTGEPGTIRSSLPASFFDSASPDTDGDGLTDTAEEVLGTNPQEVDTDGDGVSDGAEVQQGTNPLDGLPARTGIIATADTPGNALDVAVRNDLAVVADGPNGVTVFNVASGATPVAIAQVDTPGQAQSVAFEGSLVAVADGFSGLSIIDISDPPAARIAHQLPATSLAGDVRVVAVSAGLAYAGVGFDRLVVVDMASGTVLNTITGLFDVDDLAIASDELYVLTREQLRIYHVAGANLELLSVLTVSGAAAVLETGRKLFVGGGLAYIGHFTGYVVVDVSEPSVPRIIGTPPGTQMSMHDITANGSGLVLGGTSFAGLTTFAVSLFDGSDPTDVTRFITSFPTPGDSRALWIYHGVAYVADQAAGLQVLNYLPYDAKGVPPRLTLTSNFAIDGATGVAEENARMRLTASVADDVQVRSVDFYVDGQRVAHDGSFPFEHRFMTPLLAERASFTVRACAADTGGNSSCTPDIFVALIGDATPPRITRVSPDTTSTATEVTQLTVEFGEALDPATIEGALTLTEAGIDQQFGTGDDLVIGGTTAYRPLDQQLVFTLAEPLPAGLFRAHVADQIADLSGNRMAAPFTWLFTTDRLSRVSIVTTDGQASEAGPDTGTITITRTGDTASSLLVDLTSGGTTGVLDYEGLQPFVFIPAGQASVTVTVTPVLDDLVEGDEILVVTIAPSPLYVIAPPASATITIADSGITLSIVATDANASEATLDPGAFTIIRTGPTGVGFDVNLIRGGTATNLLDYQNIGLQVFMLSGQSSVTIPVTPLLDALLEGTETVTLSLAPGGYIIGTPSSATVDIADSGTTVTIAATDPAASEAGPDPGTFTVTRTGPTGVALPVNLTRSGTATAATDYSNFATSVTIPQGQSSATIIVTPTLDALLEGPETVVLAVAPGGYIVGAPDTATVTIADSGMTVSVAATDASASESGGDPGVFTVTRTGPAGIALPVNFTLGGSATPATDYANVPTSVTIPAGQASATVTITPVIDGLLEGNETVTLTLASGGYTVGSPDAATVTIADHLPVVTLAAPDPTATEGADTGSFAVTREGPTNFNLTVNFTRAGTATNGTDYSNIDTSVLIPFGQASATVTVSALVDFVFDPDETVELSLATGAYTPGAPSSATVTIVDAPPPINVSVFTLDGTASETGPDTGTFQLFRSGETTLPLTVNFTMSGTAIEGTDYAALGGSVVIPIGQSNAIVTVTPIADGLTEGTETVTLTLAPGLYTIQPFASSASLNINDGAPPNTVSVIADDPTASEVGPETGSFLIARTGSVVSALTVNLTLTGTAINGTDYQTVAATATILAGQTSTRVTITPIADALAEGSETVILTLAPGAYTVSPGQGSATLTISDTVAPSTVSIQSSAAAAAYEVGPGTFPFVVIRNGGASDVNLTVNLTITGTATNGVDYEPIPATVVIPAGQTQVAIQVIPKLDATNEVQENVTVSVAPGGYLISQFINTATIPIFEGPAPTVVSVLVSDATAFEIGRDPAAFQISRTGPSDINLTVNFTLAGPAVNGTDYDLVPLSVVIPAGQTNAYVSIVPVTDGIFENVESVILTLASGSYQQGVSASAVVNINDASLPTSVSISAFDAAAYEGPLNPAVFLVRRTGPTTNSLTVNIGRSGTATAGVDYADPGFSVVIPAGESTATIVITPNQDVLTESPETVIISLLTGAGYSVAVPSSATATIVDAAPPPALPQVYISAWDSVAYEGNRDAGTFLVWRLAPADSAVTVNVNITGTAVNGTDYETLATTVVIPAGQAVVAVPVIPLADALAESREWVTMTLAPGDYARLSTLTTATVTIVDTVSDVDNFVYVGASDATGSEVGGDPAAFLVGRTGSVASDLIVTLVRTGTAAPGTDYTDFTTSVVIPAGQVSTTVTVAPIADGAGEPVETVTLTIGAGGQAILPLNGTASVMIADFAW